MEIRKFEHYCTGCGFSIVTDYLLYSNTCPLCGEAMGHMKAISMGGNPWRIKSDFNGWEPVENKKQSAKEKK